MKLTRGTFPAVGRILYPILLCVLALIQLQISDVVLWITITPMNGEYICLNLVVLLALLLLVSAPWKRISTGGAIFSVIVTGIATANLYTVMLHGSVLTVAELENAGTAFRVLRQYSLLDRSILEQYYPIPLLFAAEIAMTIYVRKFLEGKSETSARVRLVRSAAFLGGFAVAVLFLHSGYVAGKLGVIRNSWNQTIDAKTYGYPLTVYVSAGKHSLTAPNGYSEEALEQVEMPQTDPNQQEAVQPDIFLILNESFYDLSLVSDIQTDVDYMAEYYAIDGGVFGHAVARSGGGTNSTEFELLTSIPLNTLGASTPFNVLDLRNCASVVSVLQMLGYYTIGAHCETGQNYNRLNGYSQIGFDEIHFSPDFEGGQRYDQRFGMTDESAYENIIRWYEEAKKTGQPVFTYLLTMQNHGDYGQNPPESDSVHLRSYSGEYSEENVNEYLSCIRLSGEAVSKLCDYFRQSDRPVIVCMLGDHSPSFIDAMKNKELGDRATIEASSTPLLLWANYDLPVTDADLGYRSVTAVAPLLLQLAGLQISPYYQYILNLSEDYPVITSWGEYTDASGNVYSYEEQNSQTEPIWKFFYLAYNNLLPESKEEWFALSSSGNEEC